MVPVSMTGHEENLLRSRPWASITTFRREDARISQVPRFKFYAQCPLLLPSITGSTLDRDFVPTLPPADDCNLKHRFIAFPAYSISVL